MSYQKIFSLKSNTESLRWVLIALFLGAMCYFSLISKRPKLPEANLQLLQNLLSGTNQGYNVFGHTFSPYREHLPSKGTISFIMDHSFSPYGTTIDQIYMAQSFLVPLVINPEPVEEISLVYCSDEATRDARLKETGYELKTLVRDSKGIATKIK